MTNSRQGSHNYLNFEVSLAKNFKKLSDRIQNLLDGRIELL